MYTEVSNKSNTLGWVASTTEAGVQHGFLTEVHPDSTSSVGTNPCFTIRTTAVPNYVLVSHVTDMTNRGGTFASEAAAKAEATAILQSINLLPETPGTENLGAQDSEESN